MDMEEVKLFAGTTLYFLGVIYFTECWLTQFSILVGSIIGLRFLINFPKNFSTKILTTQLFDRTEEEEL